MAWVWPCVAVEPRHVDTSAINIKQLSLEELMDIEVYSPSRRLEPYQRTPGAVYVLTGEEIRRARVTSIPDALRLVPGVNVAQVDANKWAVSIRGFNSRAANKLQVMIDGRSIYDPLFSGVLWEQRNMLLENIERIEVIRGPGGALWGTNAVNGVINIITKEARHTLGGFVTVGGGTEERAFGAARYGWRPAPDQYARVDTRWFERDAGFREAGDPHDQTRMSRTGFRWDWTPTRHDDIRVSGDFFSGEAGERTALTLGGTSVAQDVDHRGGNLLTRWNRQLSATDSVSVQFYYDRSSLDNLQLGEQRDTYDIEAQHTFAAAANHLLTWGFGYRRTRDDIRNGPLLGIDPGQRSDLLTSAFVQDSITLVPARWRLTLGTKVEHNDYTGTEWQPSAHLGWTPNAQELWWASAARAVRVPSRLETDIVFGGQRLGDGVDAERVEAYEFGYRRLLNPHVWYDIAAFYNVYHDLLTVEQNFLFGNGMNAHTYGVEIAGRWQVTSPWRLDAAYTYLQMQLDVDAASVDLARPGTTAGSSPRQQFTLRSAYDVSRQLQWDATVRFVDDLPALAVAGYTALDLGVSWFARPGMELSLVGRNLLDSHHPEFRSDPLSTELERGIYAKINWRF